MKKNKSGNEKNFNEKIFFLPARTMVLSILEAITETEPVTPFTTTSDQTKGEGGGVGVTLDVFVHAKRAIFEAQREEEAFVFEKKPA